MSFESRILLQQSRFRLIQDATESAQDEEASPMARQIINTRLDLLEQNWIKFQEEHEDLCRSDTDSLYEHQYMRARTFERCQEFYVHARANLLTRRDDIEGSLPPVISASSDSSAPRSVSRRLGALPKISLPRFSGNYAEWRPFHDLFDSLIRSNAELSEVEKMHYLKTSLAGEASKFVSNFPVSGDSFAMAWKTLVSRYENKRSIISAHLDRLTNLKPLKNKSAKDLRDFLATISETLGSLQALGCRVEHWDPLLLHSLVKLLDTESREEWEIQLGSSTSYPTFSSITCTRVTMLMIRESTTRRMSPCLFCKLYW